MKCRSLVITVGGCYYFFRLKVDGDIWYIYFVSNTLRMMDGRNIEGIHKYLWNFSPNEIKLSENHIHKWWSLILHDGTLYHTVIAQIWLRVEHELLDFSICIFLLFDNNSYANRVKWNICFMLSIWLQFRMNTWT